MYHKFLLLYTWFVRTIFLILPDQPLVMRARGCCYSFGMKNCGKNFQASGSVILRNLGNMEFGSNVYLAPNVVINAIANVVLEDEVMIGFNSVLVSGNHSCVNGSYRFGDSLKAPILVGNGSWIGANCTVVAGASLAPSSLLAANSCLKGENVIKGVYGGVPSRIIKKSTF
ncbi:hypothetical protein L2755_08125 [Shewanella abyssi]|uniref:acyltransferase n=1 Tax=Shewanella abyssi TaxID=311789 RepID=UPI00200D36D5|nr:hypothetical protein [Shewanella abyssi]MCL1049582.1 hypothetical protein [Shewanella abyssi]